MPQELVTDIVNMLTRRTYASTEGWSPIVGFLLAWVAAAAHIGGTGVANDITVSTPVIAGFVVSWVAVARKSAAAKWLHTHLEPTADLIAGGTQVATPPKP